MRFGGVALPRDRVAAEAALQRRRLGVLGGGLRLRYDAYERKNLVGLAIAKDDGSSQPPQPLNIPLKGFSTAGFVRSSAGGFGAPVPHPSSGG